MKIIKFNPKEIPDIDLTNEYVIALGKFKTFHKGHQLVLSQAKHIAEEKNRKLIIMLYPSYDGFKDNEPESFIPYHVRKRLVTQYNPEYILEFEPNPLNYSVSREEFINYLINKLNVKNVVIGKNFNFGKGKVDDHIILAQNFALSVIPMIKYNGRLISSTLVEELLKDEGAVESIFKITGFNFSYEGKVVIGNKIGTKYGTPTANVVPTIDTMIPLNGVYFSKTYIGDEVYNSITSISSNPTLNSNEKNTFWETHILDFNKNIYGKYIKVELLKFIRFPIKFNSLDELFNEIEKDKKLAKMYFAN